MTDEMKDLQSASPRDATIATAQYTRGPWMAAAGPSMHGWPIVNGEGRLICRLGWIDKQPDEAAAAFEAFKAEVAANGRLIAAAPDFEQGARAFAEYEKASAAGNDEAAMLHYANASKLLHAALAKASQAVVSTGEANPPPQGSAP